MSAVTNEQLTYGQRVHTPLATARRERTRATTALERLDMRYARDRALAIQRLDAAEENVRRLEQTGNRS